MYVVKYNPKLVMSPGLMKLSCEKIFSLSCSFIRAKSTIDFVGIRFAT